MTNAKFFGNSSVALYKSNASDADVARAAWVSHSPEAHEKEAQDGRVEGLIDFLYRNGHMSPFEHGQFTFVIETPIFVAREFMRHRTFSFNEVSGRYSELRPRFYIPDYDRPLIQTGKVGSYTFEKAGKVKAMHTAAVIEAASQTAWREYETLLGNGIAKEVARMVLPVNTMTAFWATTNPRNLMHFLELRTDDQAQHEIREVAQRMETIFAEQMPLTYKAWAKRR